MSLEIRPSRLLSRSPVVHHDGPLSDYANELAGTSYVDTTTQTGTTYHYRVVATNGFGTTRQP